MALSELQQLEIEKLELERQELTEQPEQVAAPKEDLTTRLSTSRKFEPSGEQVLIFVGQELEAVGGLEKYNDGYLDHFQTPAGWTTYSNINPGENSFGRIQEGLDGLFETHDWGDNDYNASLQLASNNYDNMALAIGLQFVNHEEKVADGTHDAYIEQLGDFLLSLGDRPVFLRIAYEFDGDPWNHYDQESTIAAYKRIVDKLRAKGVTNTAYVWQSAGSMSNQEQLEAWYPGDDYVDWLGISFFSSWRKIEMFEFARKKGKPKAGQIFRIIAQGLINSKDVAIGLFGRRLRGRKGPKVAIKAMARKVAVLYWRVMVKGLDYAEKGIQQYEEQLILNKMKAFGRLAKDLNIKITDNLHVT